MEKNRLSEQQKEQVKWVVYVVRRPHVHRRRDDQALDLPPTRSTSVAPNHHQALGLVA